MTNPCISEVTGCCVQLKTFKNHEKITFFIMHTRGSCKAHAKMFNSHGTLACIGFCVLDLLCVKCIETLNLSDYSKMLYNYRDC